MKHKRSESESSPCVSCIYPQFHRTKGYEGNKPIVLLGVVSRSDGHADTLEKERLELDVSYLCVCEQSKEDKKRNSSLMDTVRQEARKICAK